MKLMFSTLPQVIILVLRLSTSELPSHEFSSKLSVPSMSLSNEALCHPGVGVFVTKHFGLTCRHNFMGYQLKDVVEGVVWRDGAWQQVLSLESMALHTHLVIQTH